MSSEKKIIDKIVADAVAEKAKILEKSKNEADAVINKAKEQSAKIMENEDILSNAEAEKARGKEISGAEMEAKKMVLATKQECVKMALDRVKQKLSELSEQEYVAMIGTMIETAEKGEEIILSPKDKQNEALMSKMAEKNVVVADETRPLEGGFIVKKGEIEYNYSFEAILTVEKENIEQIAAEILFA